MRRPTSMDLLMHHMSQTQPSIAQTIGVILHLRGAAPPVEDLRNHVRSHLHLLPRLTHYLHGPGLKARWRHSPEPDLQSRIRHRSIPLGEKALATTLDDLVSAALPDRGPLWDIWLVTGYAADQYVICCRAHHSTQDGTGLLNTLHTLFGTPPSATALPLPRPRARTYLHAVRDTLAASAATGIWNDPERPLSGHRVSNWTQLPTEQLRTTAVSRGGDTNDAFLAGLSGAFRTWCADHWPRGNDKPLPATTMVNLRRPEERDQPGNLFSFAPAPLPCHVTTAPDRLDHVIAATRPTKDPARHTAMRHLLDRTPARAFQSLATRLTTPDRAAITTSYVAVHRPLAYGNDPVVRMQPFNWLPGNQPACVVACSYNGTTSVYFVTDAAVPGLDRLPALFLDETARMRDQSEGAQAVAVPRQNSLSDTAPAPATTADISRPAIDFALIKALLVDQAGLPAEHITLTATQQDAGIDSMAHTLLSMTLEEQLGLVLHERELAQQPTVSALVQLVAQRAAQHQ
ncbi:wax ester/triacylglycerol synthase domain-containing protein [Streptomyces lavendofoliae]|uniref:wax ester/triacylglycerol synthase domain-containing protein n=1 Tax=Streptomyces lavendofoliae TaxID=67314 RepID=UPI003D94B129